MIGQGVCFRKGSVKARQKSSNKHTESTPNHASSPPKEHHQKAPKSVKKRQKAPKSAKKCQKVPKAPKSATKKSKKRKKAPKSANKRKKAPKSAKSAKSMPKTHQNPVKTHQNVPKCNRPILSKVTFVKLSIKFVFHPITWKSLIGGTR
jgi:hypothetical protein